MGLTVSIQAGGESRRMGRNKALAPFLGEPLVQRVCRRLSGLGDERLLTTNTPEAYAFLGLPCFPDPLPGRGALGGLYAALSAARQEWVAVVACDLPFANAELLRLALGLGSGFDAVVPATERGLEPLHALYRREACLPIVRSALERGRWRVDGWFPEARVRVLRPEEYAGVPEHERAFVNVNDAAELASAEALLGPGGL